MKFPVYVKIYLLGSAVAALFCIAGMVSNYDHTAKHREDLEKPLTRYKYVKMVAHFREREAKSLTLEEKLENREKRETAERLFRTAYGYDVPAYITMADIVPSGE